MYKSQIVVCYVWRYFNLLSCFSLPSICQTVMWLVLFGFLFLVHSIALCPAWKSILKHTWERTDRFYCTVITNVIQEHASKSWLWINSLTSVFVYHLYQGGKLLRTLHLSHISSLMLAWCKEGAVSQVLSYWSVV